MSRADLYSWLVVPLLGFVVVSFGGPVASRVQTDVIESVARVLLVAPTKAKCVVVPDTLRLEISGTPPIRVCVGLGNEIARERSGGILELSAWTSFEARQSAERAADSIRAVLIPILGATRQCHWPFSWEWIAPTYKASIEVEANSDVVRPDNQWRAKVHIERKGGGPACAPP